MKRREALSRLLGLGAAALTTQAGAQAPRRIAVVHFPGGSFNRDKWAGIALLKAMRERGYEEGANVTFEFRYWRSSDELAGLMRELVRLKVDVIVAVAPPAIHAAKAATDSVPVVFVFSAEPIASGVVPNLNRPGGNLTGLAWDHGFETYAKQLELMKEALPHLRRVAILWDAAPDTTHDLYMRYYEQAAPRMGLEIVSAAVRGSGDLAPVFEKMRREKAEALIVLPSAQVTIPQRDLIMKLARQERLPTLVGIMQYTFSGALFQNAPNHSDYPRRVAAYVDRILKGAKPGDLPVEQPNKYDLVVDLRAAQALGLAIPAAILLRADKVLK